MWVVTGLAIGARYRGRHETTRASVILRLIVRARCAVDVNVIGRRVGLGVVLVRVAVCKRRGRRGESGRERESKPEQT